MANVIMEPIYNIQTALKTHYSKQSGVWVLISENHSCAESFPLAQTLAGKWLA